MPYVNWDILLAPTNLVFQVFAIGVSLAAAAQRDPALRLTGRVFAPLLVISILTYPALAQPFEDLLVTLSLFGVTIYVALRFGPSWSLFSTAWVFLALLAHVVWVLLWVRSPGTYPPELGVLISLWLYLALGALLAGVLRSRNKGRATSPSGAAA